MSGTRDFYRRTWEDGAPEHRALWAAKRMLHEAGHPLRDWAAWVLSGSSD